MNYQSLFAPGGIAQGAASIFTGVSDAFKTYAEIQRDKQNAAFAQQKFAEEQRQAQVREALAGRQMAVAEGDAELRQIMAPEELEQRRAATDVERERVKLIQLQAEAEREMNPVRKQQILQQIDESKARVETDRAAQAAHEKAGKLAAYTKWTAQAASVTQKYDTEIMKVEADAAQQAKRAEALYKDNPKKLGQALMQLDMRLKQEVQKINSRKQNALQPVIDLARQENVDIGHVLPAKEEDDAPGLGMPGQDAVQSIPSKSLFGAIRASEREQRAMNEPPPAVEPMQPKISPFLPSYGYGFRR